MALAPAVPLATTVSSVSTTGIAAVIISSIAPISISVITPISVSAISTIISSIATTVATISITTLAISSSATASHTTTTSHSTATHHTTSHHHHIRFGSSFLQIHLVAINSQFGSFQELSNDSFLFKGDETESLAFVVLLIKRHLHFYNFSICGEESLDVIIS